MDRGCGAKTRSRRDPQDTKEVTLTVQQAVETCATGRIIVTFHQEGSDESNGGEKQDGSPYSPLHKHPKDEQGHDEEERVNGGHTKINGKPERVEERQAVAELHLAQRMNSRYIRV